MIIHFFLEDFEISSRNKRNYTSAHYIFVLETALIDEVYVSGIYSADKQKVYINDLPQTTEYSKLINYIKKLNIKYMYQVYYQAIPSNMVRL